MRYFFQPKITNTITQPNFLALRTRPFLGHFACLGLALLFKGVLGGSVTLYGVIMHLEGIFDDSFSLFFQKNHLNSSFLLKFPDFSLKIN